MATSFTHGIRFKVAQNVLQEKGTRLIFYISAAGNRTRLTWPDGFYVTTDYDALNRPTTLKEQGSVPLAG